MADMTHDEHQTASASWNAYTQARDAGHTDFVEDLKKFDEFYAGEQWDQADLDALAAAGRPALTINQILPTVNTVLGEQASYRAQMRFKPRDMGTAEGADMLQKLATAVLDQMDYDWLESEVFADGMINDRGYFDVRIDYENNVFGDAAITVKDPANVVLDPNAKEYDPRTWKEVFETSWMSLDDIEDTYGEEAVKKIEMNASSRQNFPTDGYEFENTFGESNPSDDIFMGDRERTVRSVRIVEHQHFQRTEGLVLINRYGDIWPAPAFWDEEETELFAVENGYTVETRQVPHIRWTVTAADCVLLHDDWSPYPWFTIVPFFPYFRRGRPFGMVRNLISPQEQLNKLSSQELHIINTTANSGWIVEENSLGDGLTLDDLETRGSKTGFVISYKQGREAPDKIMPNQVPTGVDRMSIKAQDSIRAISGIHAPMQGDASPELSGKALQSQISRGQVQIKKPLDNLARTRRLVAERLLWLFQTFYTEERIFYVGNSLDKDASEQEIVINKRTVEGIKNDVTFGRYAVTVTQQPASDSYDSTQFTRLLEMRQLGMQIPDHIIAQYADVADRSDLVDLLKKLGGLAEPTEQEQRLARFQQDAQMQSIMLDLQAKRAKVQELMAGIDLTKAKTASEIDPNAFQNVLKVMELQAEIQQNIDNLNTRMAMSRQSNAAQNERASAQTLTQIRGQDVQQETAILTASLNGQSNDGPDNEATDPAAKREQTVKERNND